MSEEAITQAPARNLRPLFVATILAGSFLLFLVQPMVARMALPRLGGAPAVWNSAMLVYQALLLGGYAYAHWLGKLPLRTGSLIHLGLLAIAALWLPIGLFAFAMPANAEPALWVPWLLGASIGPLFFAVSAQAPLMQRWYAASEPGRDPYALYAASNVGSFGGLIAYPLIVEPTMALHSQSWLWSAGYVLLILLVAACAWMLPRGAGRPTGDSAAQTSPAPTKGRVALWIALAFVPSGLMLATSTFLTTDIVAVPLLWVLPLGLYLLSFTVAFADRRGLAQAITRFAPVTILLFGGVMIAGHQQMPYLNALMALLLLFMVAVALHSRMYDLRPAPDRLTGFYLAMSVGGALGGVFAGLLAPVVFDWTYEYPLLVLAAGALAPQAFLLPIIARLWRSDDTGSAIRLAVTAVLVVAIVWVGLANPGNLLGDKHENIAFLAMAAVGIVVVGVRLPYMIVLAGALFLFGGYRALQTSFDGDMRTRSYFGVYTVREYSDVRTLAHGTTLHGIQLLGSPERERYPTSYYIMGSGVGRALLEAPKFYGANARIGIVGLGTGTLACYAKPGQKWRFYEIDPMVVDLARDPRKFSFLSRCLPDADVVVGDARMRLAEEAAGSFDILALDAFSSDAVPMHLMTREAFETYGRVLPRNGLLLVHVSNRFLDLEPVVAASGATGKWLGAMMSYHPHESEGEQAASSDWIALTRDPSTFARLISDGGDWRPLSPRPGFTAWSDDYATILPVLRSLR
ncbi:fused MFS/spermidine synthase [Sphingomonas sp.]|uniref:fused MFS/spermidine synthase n=1 Tax=Sphingomonas sp. TaxID=28214 RepID=UPI002DD62FEE|nr:fused MFS/spermidine synthase [Sphingomonas sp.]